MIEKTVHYAKVHGVYTKGVRFRLDLAVNWPSPTFCFQYLKERISCLSTKRSK